MLTVLTTELSFFLSSGCFLSAAGVLPILSNEIVSCHYEPAAFSLRTRGLLGAGCSSSPPFGCVRALQRQQSAVRCQLRRPLFAAQPEQHVDRTVDNPNSSVFDATAADEPARLRCMRQRPTSPSLILSVYTIAAWAGASCIQTRPALAAGSPALSCVVSLLERALPRRVRRRREVYRHPLVLPV